LPPPNQLVENEEIIGTLIETNERIVTAIEMYDRLLAQDAKSTTAVVTARLPATQIIPESETIELPKGHGAAVDRVRGGTGKDQVQDSSVLLHPDLQELNFGPLGTSSSDLPPPLRPSTRSNHSSDRNAHTHDTHGSLSDFSDYDSSEEEHSSSARFLPQTKGGSDHLDGSDDHTAGSTAFKPHPKDANPFADPFADDAR